MSIKFEPLCNDDGLGRVVPQQRLYQFCVRFVFRLSRFRQRFQRRVRLLSSCRYTRENLDVLAHLGCHQKMLELLHAGIKILVTVLDERVEPSKRRHTKFSPCHTPDPLLVASWNSAASLSRPPNIVAAVDKAETGGPLCSFILSLRTRK